VPFGSCLFLAPFLGIDMFCKVMDACTENYECLVLDNTSKSNKIEDCCFLVTRRRCIKTSKLVHQSIGLNIKSRLILNRTVAGLILRVRMGVIHN